MAIAKAGYVAHVHRVTDVGLGSAQEEILRAHGFGNEIPID